MGNTNSNNYKLSFEDMEWIIVEEAKKLHSEHFNDSHDISEYE